ncbi:MAG: hypothetical protein QM680_10695 [Luteolibacter sp.]
MSIELNGADEATVGPIREALRAASKARALRFPDAEVSPPSSILPAKADRAGKALAFDETGAPIAIEPGSTKDGGASLPTGGTAGQVLTKVSSDDGDAEWADPSAAGVSLPSGGEAGQFLKKLSDDDGDAAWAFIPPAPWAFDSLRVVMTSAGGISFDSWEERDVVFSHTDEPSAALLAEQPDVLTDYVLYEADVTWTHMDGDGPANGIGKLYLKVPKIDGDYVWLVWDADGFITGFDWSPDRLWITPGNQSPIGTMLSTNEVNNDTITISEANAGSGEIIALFRVLGTLEDEEDLPLEGDNVGDAYIVESHVWVWGGSEWIDAGAIVGPQGPAGADGIDGTNGIDGAPGAAGEKGDKGDQGDTGEKGEDGVGVPAGGTAGQVLAKISGTDYDTGWIDAASGGGSLTNFSESVNSSSPNTSIPVVSLAATNAATNVDLALVPKGTGGFLLAVPDGATTGGNKRGNYAVDLQLYRTAAAQAARGPCALQRLAGYARRCPNRHLSGRHLNHGRDGDGIDRDRSGSGHRRAHRAAELHGLQVPGPSPRPQLDRLREGMGHHRRH